MSRLGETIHKIMTGKRQAGMARVISRVGTELRLSGMSERCLIAGNSIPTIGERVPWVRLDDARIVTSRNLTPLLLQQVCDTPGREWQQILICDYTGISTGSTSNRVYGLWRDSWQHWWAATIRWDSVTGYHLDVFRGDFDTSPWSLQSTVDELAYAVGHDNALCVVYRPKAGGYPNLRSRQATISEDGSVAWSEEVLLPDDSPLQLEGRYLHLIRVPAGYLWCYVAPRTPGQSGGFANYHFYIYKSVLPDSLAGGWQLQYQSSVAANGIPVGFLAHNGNRCSLLRQSWVGSADRVMLLRTSADWATEIDSGISGKRFRALWADAAWWLSYGRGGSYYASTGLYWRNGGCEDCPVWGEPTTLAADGALYRLIVPYADDTGAALLYGTGTQLWRADLPEDEGEGDWPRSYTGPFNDGSSFIFPAAVEPGEAGTLALQEGLRIWAARMTDG